MMWTQLIFREREREREASEVSVWGPWFPAACLTGQTKIVGPLSYFHQETAVTVQPVPHIVKLRPHHHLLLVQLHILDNSLPLRGAFCCLRLSYAAFIFYKLDIVC